MVSIVSNVFHSAHLTFRNVKSTDGDLFVDYLARDNGAMLEWFGFDPLEILKMSDTDKSKKMIGIYQRNTNRKKHMIHILKKHTNTIIGVVNIWTDLQQNKRVAVYLTKDMRRKGFGAETQKRVLQEVCRRNSRIQKLVAQTDGDNISSIRSLCSIGFRHVGARRFASPPGYKEPQLSQTFMRPRFK